MIGAINDPVETINFPSGSNNGSSEVDEAGEVDCAPIIACDETAEMFKAIEASLDAIAVPDRRHVHAPVLGRDAGNYLRDVGRA